MKKSKPYDNARFDGIAFSAIDSCIPVREGMAKVHSRLSVMKKSENWSFDSFDEFLAAVDGWLGDYYAYTQNKDHKQEGQVIVAHYPDGSISASVAGPTRDYIEKIFAVIDKQAERCQLPEQPPPARLEPEKRVFIGHGGNQQWRDLKDHLHEKHKYDIEAYEIGSRAGHTIRDILEEMMDRAAVALLVMTGEDATEDGKVHARQNVVHEAGLFQGKLGFSRAIILLEEGTEEFSNIHGLQQIRFSKGNIRESFGDTLAFLKRELG